MANFRIIQGNRQPVIPKLYLEALTESAMELLYIDRGRHVALIMGYPMHIDNYTAIETWIHEYLRENPERINFKDHVFPALRAFLEKCQADMYK